MEMFYFLLFAVVVLLLLVNSKPKKKEEYPYERKNYLMTKAERNFYEVLQACATEKNLTIMSKVRLWDLLYVSKGTEKRMSFENKIRAKHVDFVLCEPKLMKPKLVIELDDKSHERKDRKASDIFKDKSLAAAKLPLMRVKVQKQYSKDAIKKQIMDKIK